MARQRKRIPQLPPRDRSGHKGEYGHVLIVGGSRGMIGAPALAAEAALRAGAGLATIAAPEPVQLFVASLCMCATSVPLTCDAAGLPAPAAVREMLEAAKACDVLAVGPGMGVSPGAMALVRAALEQEKPVVLDADGLNNLARIDGPGGTVRWCELRRCPLVLTPHPGEFSRLTGRTVAAIQARRRNLAKTTAAVWRKAGSAEAPLVLVLKGAGTVVTDGTAAFVNCSGNPGMATGGSGDVLTGVIAALIGQGLSPMDSAVLGVHVHGLAGDLAAEEIGEVSLMASDLPAFLPDAFVQL